ncbi:CLUMA_CG013003, isoform A [Clunio marinus]|uniref:CLUMA_CG013003, isoform A n=1 Tax=Clunio marinus TaxID=568069 RepID=A0A1J1IIX6_9DIPT|nr:CLUMA_CG013003, isoform A [Clunio marinus]
MHLRVRLNYNNKAIMDLSIQKNIRTTCRTCLRIFKSKKELICLFDYDQTYSTTKIKYSEMLKEVVKHQVFEDDLLPKRICVFCLQQTRSAFYFKLQAEESYQTLMTQLGITPVISPELIKKESSAQECTQNTNERIEVTPHPVDLNHQDGFQDLLVEIEPPKIQEPIISQQLNDDESEDNEEFADYEPFDEEEAQENFSDHEQAPFEDNSCPRTSIGEMQPSSSKSSKSPDSGISDDANRILNTNFNENQILESQRCDAKDFECDICFKQMFSLKSLSRHKRNFHNANESRCPYCKRKSFNQATMNLHIRYRHPTKYNEYRLGKKGNAVVVLEPLLNIPQCNSCDHNFPDMTSLYRHHANCDKICIKCEMKFNRKDFYFLHLDRDHGIKITESLECPFGCVGSFNSEKVLNNHIQSNHPDDKDNESIAESISEECESISNDSTAFQCEVCDASFPFKRGLTNHINQKHSKANQSKKLPSAVQKYSREEFIDKFIVQKSALFHRCVICEKDIHRKSVNLHLKNKHASFKRYICELCPVSFVRTDYRMRHMHLTHPENFRCDKCNVQFDRNYKYDGHMEEQHGIPAKHLKPEEGTDNYDLNDIELKYIEDTSTYDYSSEIVRRNSVLSTSNSQQTEVPMTKDEFIEKHIETLSEKNTHCNVCQQKMHRNSIISHLLWKHAVKRPLKCAFCNDRMVKNNARLNHMARCHPDEYHCKMCEEQFVRHEFYVNHMKEEHGKVVTSKPSSGEEDDLNWSEIRFVAVKDEMEPIEEADVIPTVVNNDEENETQVDVEYECELCDRIFTSPKNLLIHKSHKHKEESKVSFNYFEFCDTFTTALNSTDIRCNVCSLTMRKKNFGCHLKCRHAVSGAFKCAVCPNNFFRPEHRMQHMSKSHPGMFFCSTCNIQFYVNSRFSLHMRDQHDIEIDPSDNYKVDLNLNELQYQAKNQNFRDEDAIAVPSIIHEDEEQNEDELSRDEQREMLTREEFLERYITTVNRTTRKCHPCDKTILSSSIFNHLMSYHATILPYKCPFCDLRLLQNHTRIRHIQIFHPNDYKCTNCGLQYYKHATYAEHMLIEHNTRKIQPKSAGEEKDLSSFEIKYVKDRRDDMQDEDLQNSETSSTTSTVKSPYKVSEGFLIPKVKKEPIEKQLTVRSSVESKKEFDFTTFKEKFLIHGTNSQFKCIPCKRLVMRNQIHAHLRYWHAKTMSYNCELCDAGFRRSDYMKRHLQTTHPNNFYCSHCNEQFLCARSYNIHMSGQHKVMKRILERKPFEVLCVPLPNLKYAEHVDIRFKENDLVKVSSPDERMKHMSNKHKESFRCSYCKEQFYCSSRFTDHMLNEHGIRLRATFSKPIDEIDIPLNNLRFIPKKRSDLTPSQQPVLQPAKSEGIRKVAFIKNKNLFSDLPDDIEFTREEFYGKFYRRVDGKKFIDGQTKCFACGKSFSTKSRLCHAISNHAIRAPFSCELCPKKYFRLRKRFLHMSRSHPNDYRCNECDIQYDRAYKYADHMKGTHNLIVDVPYFDNEVYDIPTAKIRYMKNLLRKKDVKKEPEVVDENNASIDEMPFHFLEMENLKCSICEETFDSSRSLRFHLRNHTNIGGPSNGPSKEPQKKPPKLLEEISRLPISTTVKCEVCSLTFGSLFALNLHMKHVHGFGIDPDEKEGNSKKSEVECDICDFTSERRDKVETHVKLEHKPEFACCYCSKICSSYNSFRMHIHNLHGMNDYKDENLFQCTECHKRFSKLDSMEKHRESKHLNGVKIDHRCQVCGVIYPNSIKLQMHFENHHHKELEHFITNVLEVKATPPIIKSEPIDEATENDKIETDEGNEILDPFFCMLKNVVQIPNDNENDEPATKKMKIDEDLEEKRLPIPPRRRSIANDNDRVEYLNHLQCKNGLFRCGLCPKISKTRRYMLRHLKHHKEIPTYKCSQCSAKFVFKKKFDRHVRNHHSENGENVEEDENVNEEVVSKEQEVVKIVNVDEHPKFQELSSPKVDSNDEFDDQIKCEICKMTFKLTIILNRHNSIWHGEGNPNKHLTMMEQKEKKGSSKSELNLKLLRCKFCSEAFIKPHELEAHTKDVHLRIERIFIKSQNLSQKLMMSQKLQATLTISLVKDVA